MTVGWHRGASGDLQVEWREAGGPRVEPPKRKGFGTTIIDRSVPYDLGGTATVSFDPKGVHAIFTIPSRHLSEGRLVEASHPIKYPRAALGHPTLAPPALLKDRHVLLVEDSLIIALDAEDIVHRLGAENVTTAGTVQGALDGIEAYPPGFAILDVNLGDRTSYPVADRLAELNVPFLFATGYGEQANLPRHHHGRLVVQKPYTVESIARAVDAMLVASGGEN